MTKPRTSRSPVPGVDPRDGAAVLLIPLARDGGVARILPADYERLLAAGLSPNWCLNRDGTGGTAYVRAALNSVAGNLVTVARVLMAARPGQRVRYLDSDTRNLRRDNLVLRPGFGRRADAALVERAASGSVHA
ncbi:MAG: hypothetical protein U0987_18900 [Afipia sp.]|nr:hypothetical protein [Afipia sp.]